VAKHPSKDKRLSAGADAEDPDDVGPDCVDPDFAEMLSNMLPFMVSEELDKVRGYVERGRRFARVDSAALKDAWVVTLGKLPPDPVDPDLRSALDDIGAELQLRGEEPPAERAQAELDAFVQSVDALVADARKAHPEAWARYNVELAQDVHQFIQQKKRGN